MAPMPRRTGPGCRSSHGRTPAPPELVRLQHGDRPVRLRDVAELLEAAQRAVDVLAAGADHPRQGPLRERDPDRDRLAIAYTFALRQLQQLVGDPAGDVEEGDLGDRRVLPADEGGETGHEAQQQLRMIEE